MAKSLFIFTFLLDLLYKEKCGKVSCHKCHSHISHRSCHMMSYDECGKVVHRSYSSCISSIENLTRTSLSSLCQLGLRGWLSCLRLSCYITQEYHFWSGISVCSRINVRVRLHVRDWEQNVNSVPFSNKWTDRKGEPRAQVIPENVHRPQARAMAGLARNNRVCIQ